MSSRRLTSRSTLVSKRWSATAVAVAAAGAAVDVVAVVVVTVAAMVAVVVMAAQEVTLLLSVATADGKCVVPFPLEFHQSQMDEDYYGRRYSPMAFHSRFAWVWG